MTAVPGYNPVMMVASVILIDDDSELRQTLTEILTDAGYEVRAVATGAQALTLFGERPSDIVVTDIYMPDMDGIELIRTFRDQGIETPILAMSGKREDSSYLAAARVFGATGVLQKPFRGTAFLDAVVDCINGSAGGN